MQKEEEEEEEETHRCTIERKRKRCFTDLEELKRFGRQSIGGPIVVLITSNNRTHSRVPMIAWFLGVLP